jgi:hypothetical protein
VHLGRASEDCWLLKGSPEGPSKSLKSRQRLKFAAGNFNVASAVENILQPKRPFAPVPRRRPALRCMFVSRSPLDANVIGIQAPGQS